MKEYTFNINGNTYNVVIHSVSGDTANVTVNGVSYQVGMQDNTASGTQTIPAQASPVQEVTSIAVQSAPAVQTSPNSAPAPSGAGKAVKSPLPGVIISVNVTAGDVVKAGQVVAVLEAMKMENEIQAEFDGIVTAVNVTKGDSVLEGAAIVTIG